MSVEKRMETLEGDVQHLAGEFRLLKAEIKQSLMDLREFILRRDAPFAPESFSAGPPPSRAVAAPIPPARRNGAVETGDREPGALLNATMARLAEGRATVEKALEEMSASMGTKQPGSTGTGGPDAVTAHKGASIQALAQTAGPRREGPQPGQGAINASHSSARTLDLSMVANLIRWMSQARVRVGEHAPEKLLELYRALNQVSAADEATLTAVQRLLEGCPGGQEEAWAREYVSLLLELHGLMAGRIGRG